MSEFNRFNVVYNGYDQYQVNDEIDRLQYEIQSLNDKIVMYQNQIETISNQYNVIKQRYQLLVSESSMKEQAIDSMSKQAILQANEIIQKANQDADKIIQEAIINAQSLLNEVSNYNQETYNLKEELKNYMITFTQLLDKYNQPAIPNIQETIEGFQNK